MAFDYSKLWKLLIDKGMIKTKIRLKVDISASIFVQLGKNKLFNRCAD